MSHFVFDYYSPQPSGGAYLGFLTTPILGTGLTTSTITMTGLTPGEPHSFRWDGYGPNHAVGISGITGALYDPTNITGEETNVTALGTKTDETFVAEPFYVKVSGQTAYAVLHGDPGNGAGASIWTDSNSGIDAAGFVFWPVGTSVSIDVWIDKRQYNADGAAGCDFYGGAVSWPPPPIPPGTYVPQDIVSFSQPVYSSTIGSQVSRLNGAIAANGTGILAWVDHNNRYVRSAVVDPDTWLSEDVVQPEDVVTIADFNAEIAVYSVGVFNIGDTFYAIVHGRRQGMLVNNEVYVSYDLGGSWSYRSTYIAQGNPSSGHDGVFTSTPLSLPYVIGNRWLWTSSQVQGGPAPADRVPRVTIVESANAGVSVTTRLNTGAGRYSLFTEHISSQIVQDPVTGYLYMSTGGSGSAIDSWYMYRSTDAGVSWPAVINFGDGSNYYIPFTNDGEYMYALRYWGGLYRMVDPLVQSTWEYVGSSGGASGHGRFHWIKDRPHFFNYGDQIWSSGTGWQVGSLGFG